MKRQHSRKNKPLNPRTLAILTSGGDCPGLNAAIRAIVRAAEPLGLRCLGALDGFQGLTEDHFVPLDREAVSGILHRGGTILGTSRFNPFEQKNGLSRIKKNLKRHHIDLVVNIGGEGTMRASEAFEREGISCLGLPKTIDNDIWGTESTFGFDTAVTIATEAIDRLHTTAESHHRVMLVEVMGRFSGWIATYAGMAGGAHAILIPEQTFSLSRLLEMIRRRQKIGKRFSIVVVSEAAKILLDRQKSPQLLQIPIHKDEHGNPQLGGITPLLETELRKHLPIEIRSTILGHVQRGGIPTPGDRVLATRLGVAAARFAAEGCHGAMLALRKNQIVPISLEKVVKKTKTVPQELYETAQVFF